MATKTIPSPPTSSLLVEYLNPKSEAVKVGDLELGLERMSLYRHQRFFSAVAKLDLTPLTKVFTDIFGEGGEGWLPALPEVISHGLDILGNVAGEALGQAVAAALDTERNFSSLKTEHRLGPDPKSAERAGLYLGSEALQAWVELNCQIPQAVHVVLRTIELNAYDLLGKAATRKLASILSQTMQAANAGNASGPPGTSGNDSSAPSGITG